MRYHKCIFLCNFDNNTHVLLTIMETPATTMKVERRPSEMFIVTDWLTSDVSADNLLTSSPVLFLSKNAISCFIMEPNTVCRSVCVMRWPEKITSPSVVTDHDHVHRSATANFRQTSVTKTMQTNCLSNT
jgi:hypothetical protein